MISKLVLSIILLIQTAHGDYILNAQGLTNWGVWGEFERCNYGSFSNQIQLKVEKNQGGGNNDDSALNAIKLSCASKNRGKLISNNASITSRVGTKGDWGKIFTCENNEFITGVQLRSEAGIGGAVISNGNLEKANDDTAGNNLRVFCGWRLNYTELDGLDWGEWRPKITCDEEYAVCGISTLVENLVKTREGILGDDNTGLNNLKIECCKIRESSSESESQDDAVSYGVSNEDKMVKIIVSKIIEALKTLI